MVLNDFILYMFYSTTFIVEYFITTMIHILFFNTIEKKGFTLYRTYFNLSMNIIILIGINTLMKHTLS